MYKVSISFEAEGTTEDIAIDALLFYINEFTREAGTKGDGLDDVKVEEIDE